MVNNTKIPLFRRWVLQNFPFIEQDFDALTDYQLICKVVEYLNKCIETVNASSEQIELLTNSFNQLEDYVDHYFDNLDVQEEINNKLDEMADDGTLATIVSEYLNSVALFTYDNVATMKLATNFVNGSFAKTLGYTSVGDGGASVYRIRTKEGGETANEINLIALQDNTLIAEIVPTPEMFVKQFGAKGDGETDETSLLQAIFTYCNANNVNTIYLNEGTYNTSDTINIYSNSTIKGAGIGNTTIKMTSSGTMLDNKYTLYFNNSQNLVVEGISFEGAKDPTDYTIVEDKKWHSLTLSNSSNITIENCEFKYFFTSGISIRNSSNVLVNNCVFTSNGWNDIAITRLTDNIKVTNNHFTNICARGVNAEDGSVDQPCSNVLIRGNIFKTLNTSSNNTRAISFSNGSLSGDVHRYTKIIITNNTFDGLWEGILYNFAKDVVIANNIANVARFTNATIGSRTSYNERIIITNNEITPSHTYSGGKLGINSQRDKNVIIKGNNIHCGVTDHSITVADCYNAIVDNNIITGSGKAGIRATGTNVSITNNEITDTTNEGLSVDASNADIVNNRIINTGSYGINVGGTNIKNLRVENNYVFNPTDYGIDFHTGTGNKFAVIRNNWIGEDRVTPAMTYAVYARVDIDYVVVENTYLLSNTTLKNSTHWGSNCYFRNNEGFGTLPTPA